MIRYDGARGVVWKVKYRDAAGVQVKETVGAERDGVTRKQAEAILRDRLVRVEQKGYERPKPLTFGEYARTWLGRGEKTSQWKPTTAAIYRRNLEIHLIPAFGRHRLGETRPRDIAAWIADMMEKPQGHLRRPLSAKTVILLLDIAHFVYESALQEELASSNPFAHVRRPKVRRRKWRILEPHEVRRVLASFDDGRYRCAFMALTLTGLRRSELQHLRWRDVSLTEQTLRVVESKSEDGERLLSIPAALVSALEEHFTTSPYRADSDFVFCNPETGTRLQPTLYGLAFRQALAAAGITDYVRPFHDARHGALTNLAATGTSEMRLMQIAGHSSIATTKQYIDLAGKVFPDEAAALERRMLGDPVPNSGTKLTQTA